MNVPGAAADGAAAAFDVDLSVDHRHPRVLLHLVLAELLARLEHDQHRAGGVVRVEDDRVAGAVRRGRRVEVPALHGRSVYAYTQPLFMPLVVDSFVMGPFQSNCYVVRSERGAAEAAVIDPGDDPTPLRLELAGMGARTAAILVTHTDVDHIGGVAALAEGTGAEVWAPSGEVEALKNGQTRGGMRVPPYDPEHVVSGGDEIAVAGITFDVVDVPGHSAGHVAFYADGHLFSGDLLFAGSVGRVDLAGRRLGHAARLRARAARPLPGRHDRASRATARRRRSSASCRRTRSCATSAPRAADGGVVPGAARDARRPPGRRQLVGAPRADGGDAPPLRLAAHPDAGLRGHGALRAHVGRRVRRRAQGDVHVRGSQRPVAHASPRGHGADRARVRRARAAPRPAAGEGVHDRADVPLRPSRSRPLPRALPGVGRGDRERRSCDRRRGDRGVHRDPPPARRDAVGAAPQLDRRRRRAGPRTSSG